MRNIRRQQRVQISPKPALIGIDEVGRGCWAGPLLVVAARQTGELPAGLQDSKVLSKKRRESLFYDIQLSCDTGEGWVAPAEIDKYGLAQAMRLGTARALKALKAAASEHIIFDGNTNYCDAAYKNVQAIIDADALHPVVSAASVYAKVKRDRYMAGLPAKYAGYEFERHAGYGTRLHHDLIKLYGVSDLHRKSYAPVKALL